MPGVLQPTVLDTVHRTCKEVVELDPNVKIDKDAINNYVKQLDAAAVRAAGSRASVFPIKFDSLEAEVNFLCLFHLLDFGSGYDALLRASSSRRGAAETIQYGCFGLALSAARLDGAWMRGFTAYHVHTAFGIESKVEEELQPGITISKPGPLAPLSAAIQSTITETGKVLGNLGVKSLGAFVMEHLDGLKAAGKPFTAASLVEELADNFPGFQDSGLYTPAAAAAEGAPEQQQQQQQPITVLYLRKAQSLAADLEARFGGEDERFRWTDADKLTADSGALLPAVLRQLGIISYSQELSAVMDSQQPQQQQCLPQGNDERAIRAAAVAAVDEVVAAVAAASPSGSSSVTARVLSNYLLSLVKDNDDGQQQQQQQQQMFQGVAVTPHKTVGTSAY